MDREFGPEPARPKPFTVKQLTLKIQKAFEADPDFRMLSVVGEISNFKRNSTSGHIYFTLKEGSEAQIGCVFFKFANKSLDFSPKEGMEVVLLGEVKVYPPYGSYQFYVKKMLPSGLGAFYARFEELRKKLVEEGITDSSRKRELPSFPRRIGIVASRDSAGYQDVLKVLNRRFPLAEVVLAAVPVEGEASAPGIARGLRAMAERGEADVVIVCRGGGSIESLWGFNTEDVARAIAAMPVPVITAIGHETDTTIADLVSDRRAATPTEAAELATPSVDELSLALKQSGSRIRGALGKNFRTLRERLEFAARLLRSPQAMVELRLERLDRIGERIYSAAENTILRRERILSGFASRLAARSPENILRGVERRLAEFSIRAANAAQRRIERASQATAILETRLNSANPTAILARGYAVPMRKGRAVRDASELGAGDELELKLHRGAALVEVKSRTLQTE